MVEAGRPTLTDPQNTFGLNESDVRSARKEAGQTLSDFSPERSKFPLVYAGMQRRFAALMQGDDPEDILRKVGEVKVRFDDLKEAGEGDIGRILVTEFPDILDYGSLLSRTPQGLEVASLVDRAKIAMDPLAKVPIRLPRS